jgi:hypothetical protein
MTILNEYRTHRRFCADAISTACYISNRIFLCSILNLTPYELRFGRKSFIPHLRLFRCRCFVLKCGNIDKFESCSSDSILLGYNPHDRSYRLFNFETNTVVELYDMTFDETSSFLCDVFKCADDKKKEENIFIDKDLQGFNSDEDGLCNSEL